MLFPCVSRTWSSPPTSAVKRNGFGCGEGRVPPGSVLHRFDGVVVCILVFIRRSLPHKLLAGLWMLALTEFRKVIGRDRSARPEPPGQSPLPLLPKGGFTMACFHSHLNG